MRAYQRYVAIGDSSTEGLQDPGPHGHYRGWADRFAQHVARAQDAPLLYANLAIRGRKTRHLVEEQLEPALAMRPDLATVFSGTNDLIRRRFDLDAVIADLDERIATLEQGIASILRDGAWAVVRKRQPFVPTYARAGEPLSA